MLSIFKVIKKVKKILTYILSTVVLLLVFLNLLINFPAVQTWLCHRIAGYYSKKLHAKVEIGHVDFEFIKKLVLRNVYVEDQHADTLFYANTLKLDVGALSFDKHILRLSNIDIEQTKVHFIKYKNEKSLNMQFIIDAFASKDTTAGTGPKWDVSFDGLTLDNVDFTMQNRNDTSVTGHTVNFKNLQVHNISSYITDIKFEGDTVRATIERLTALERCGFFLKNMSCYVKLSSHGMELDALHIETPQTDLATDLIFHFKSFKDFDDFETKVDMKAVFKKSKVCFEDVGYFAKGLDAVHTCFSISGQYTGTINHLRGRDMEIGWGKISAFRGDAVMDGLPYIDTTYMKINVNSLVTSKPDVESLPRPPFDVEHHIELPANIAFLDVMKFKGSFDGYISNFNATGMLVTDIGSVVSSLNLRQDTVHNTTYYKGSLQTMAFNIGEFLHIKDMGCISSSVIIQGAGLSKDNADAKVTGTLEALGYKGYNYKDITLNGELRKGFFSGLVKADDPNLHFDFDGKVDIASKIHSYQFDSRVYAVNLAALHIVKDSAATAIFSSHIKVNAEGNSPDEMAGIFEMDSTIYRVHKDIYHINYLTLKSGIKGFFHSISLKSDYADADISGHFEPTTSLECFQNMLASYLPGRFEKEKHAKNDKEYHDYEFDIRFNENTSLTDLFIPSLKMAKGTVVKGYYKETGNDFSLTGQSAKIEWNGRKMDGWMLNAKGNESKLDIKSASDTLKMSDSLYAVGFKVDSKITNDTVHYTIGWNNDSANNANIPGFIAMSNKVQTTFKLISPVITLADSSWMVNKQNLLTIDTSGMTAQDLMFYHNRQYISLMGKLSNKKSDALVIDFHSFNLEDLLISGPPLKGMVDGTASISNAYNHPFFVSALNVSNLNFNNVLIGNATVNSYWDNETQSIATNGQIMNNDDKSFSFLGNYYPNKDSDNISIDATLHGMQLKPYATYVKVVSSVLDGDVSGNFHVSGNLNNPRFYGNLMADVRKIKIDYLNTNYHASEIDITVRPDTFLVKPSMLFDDHGDTAILSGTVSHEHFKNFKMNIGVSTNNFLCLDTKNSEDNAYYGVGYVAGNVSIYGYLNSLHIDANITTEKGTVFNIPFSNASEVEESDFIHFVDKKAPKAIKVAANKVNPNGLQMSFNVHVTPDAEAHLVIASKVGDELTSTGSGNIQLGMSNFGEFSIKGNYTIESGNYKFVLQNIINKDFTLQPGGTIEWNGDPYNADVDIYCVHEVRTNLAPLFPFDSTGAYKRNIPVYCGLELRGKITAPDIKFSIDLPTVDADTKTTVDSYMSTPDELNRQIFSLLIISSFLPIQEGANNATSAAPTQNIYGYAGYAALTSQLNNLLNSISKQVNIGVNYTPGTALSAQEAQVLLSTELLGGRVEIHTDVAAMGTTASGAPTENSNNVVGEVTVDYKVSKDGKVKVKAFNKANDYTTTNLVNSPYTQGVGLSYSEGFNTRKELWEKIKSKFKRKPEKEQPVKKSDSSK